MISGFNEVFAIVIGKEEGSTLSLDPKDPGNWTGGKVGVGELKGSKFGISAASFPHVDIPNLTYGMAMALAKQRYWDVYGCDQFDSRIGYLIFDAAYNGGHPALWLQEAAGVKADGVIGAGTIAAVRKVDPLKIVLGFMASRFQYWTECAAWPAEHTGWVRRGATLQQIIAQNS